MSELLCMTRKVKDSITILITILRKVKDIITILSQPQTETPVPDPDIQATVVDFPSSDQVVETPQPTPQTETPVPDSQETVVNFPSSDQVVETPDPDNIDFPTTQTTLQAESFSLSRLGCVLL